MAQSEPRLLSAGYLSTRPPLPIQTAVLDRLGQMFGADIGTGRHVGDGAAYFQDAVVGTGAEAQAVHRFFEEALSYFIDAADLA